MRDEPLGVLLGVPLTVKSCIDVADWPCAAGSLLRKRLQAERRRSTRSATSQCRCNFAWQHEYAGISDGLRNGQLARRKNEQPVESKSFVRRIKRRRSGHDRLGMFRRRGGQRWRRFGSRAACRLLRHLVTEADAGAYSFERSLSG